MKTAKDAILHYLETHSKLTANQLSTPFTTKEIADTLYIERSNVSRILNDLHKENLVIKETGKPVIYRLNHQNYLSFDQTFNSLVGYSQLLDAKIKSLKSAVLYPPFPLPIFISGMSGTGKTQIANYIYSFAKEKVIFNESYSFQIIDCKSIQSDAVFDSIFDNPSEGLILFDNVDTTSDSLTTYLAYKINQYYTDYSYSKHKTIFVFTSKNSSINLFQLNLGINISLPNINRYSLVERFLLTKKFFLIEARNLGVNIHIESSTISLFLLYLPKHNITQLANDIRVSCSKAYFDNQEDSLIINTSHLPSDVLKGFFNYAKLKEHLDEIIRPKTLYTFDAQKLVIQIQKDSLQQNLVTYVPGTIHSHIKNNSIQTDIQMMVNQQFEAASSIISSKQLKRNIGERLYNMVTHFFDTCQNQFRQLYSEKNIFALSIILDNKIQKNTSNADISDELFNYVLTHYSDEFKIAAEFVIHLEKTFNISFSLKEIALLCPLISNQHLASNEHPRPGLLIIMHGENGAKSMADVVNNLLNINIAHAYDMPLNEPISLAYEHITKLLQEINQGFGVLILSDMGSLSFFGSILSNELDIKTRTLEMVSTPIALEAAQRITQESDIDIIFDDLIHYNSKNSTFQTSLYKLNKPKKKNVIITICLTGEGSAIKLKNMIEQSAIIDPTLTDIIPLSILNHEDSFLQIDKIAKKKEILAIVGTINPNIHNIPFISIDKMLMNNNYSELKQIIENNLQSTLEDEPTTNEELLNNVKNHLANEIQPYNYTDIHNELLVCISIWKNQFKKDYSIDKQIGLIVHIASSIENIILKIQENKIRNMSLYTKAYEKELLLIKNSLYNIENTLNIQFSESQIIYLLILLLELKED